MDRLSGGSSSSHSGSISPPSPSSRSDSSSPGKIYSPQESVKMPCAPAARIIGAGIRMTNHMRFVFTGPSSGSLTFTLTGPMELLECEVRGFSMAGGSTGRFM